MTCGPTRRRCSLRRISLRFIAVAAALVCCALVDDIYWWNDLELVRCTSGGDGLPVGFGWTNANEALEEANDTVRLPSGGARPPLTALLAQRPCFAIDGPMTAAAVRSWAVSACDKGRGAKRRPLVLIWVYSSPGNVEARARVRGTWGSVRDFEGYAIRVLFFVGLRAAGATAAAAAANGAGGVIEDRLLVDENRAHGDIVQDVSYVDSYEYLSFKGASGLRWLSKHCSNDPDTFTVKVDDDTLVSPFALVRYLRSADLSGHIACKLQVQARPQRLPDKWFEDPLDFPDATYPNYCQGFAYILPMSVVRLLESGVGKTLVPRMEDVYVTGVLAQFAGIPHKPLPSTAWLLVFPSGYEATIDNKTDVIFVSDTFIPSRVDYFWRKQKEIYRPDD